MNKAFLSVAVWMSLMIQLSQAAPTSRAAYHNERPNILFIYTDDQSWQTLGCYNGNWPWVKTPNIDRLAAMGVRFNFAYGASWCAPSRACVMTGLYPHAIRGLKMKEILTASYDPKVCRFWPSELRKAGYRTTHIGKWHLGPDGGYGRDWDHQVMWDQNDRNGNWYYDRALSIDGAPKKVVPGYATDVYTQFALEEIKRKHDKPWLMWLCYNAPHGPLTVHPRHQDRYEGAPVPIPFDVYPPRLGKPTYMQTYGMWTRDPDDPDGPPRRGAKLPDIVRDYNRLVCGVDEGVGRLLAALEETGQLDNTMIVYTSDQGFAIGERGFYWKVGPYEACMRMPLIISFPRRFAQGGVCQHPIGIVNLPPTFLALAGVPLPWEMNGHDLQPLLKNPQADWPHTMLLEHTLWCFGSETDRGLTGKDIVGDIPWWVGVWKGRYKYVRTLVPNEIEELYEFTRDQDEKHNLALDPNHAGLLKEYREKLLAELTRTKAGMVKNLPAPKVN